MDFEETKQKALRLLEFRSHSEQELRKKLTHAGAERADIESVLDFLRQYSLVNDREYARRLAKDLQALKKLGKFRIKAELANRGINAEDIESAMLCLEDEGEDVLLPLLRKRLGGNFDKKNLDKAIRYFIYRGYSIEDVKNGIERLKEEEEYGI